LNKINKKVLFVALILALITAYLTYKYLDSLKEKAAAIEYKKILVAAQEIGARVKITASMLKEIEVVSDTYVPESIQSRELLIDRFTKDMVAQGEVIPESRLLKEEEMELALRIPLGKRAMAVTVDEFTGVGDLIKSEDFVDVYVFLQQQSFVSHEGEIFFPEIAELLIQNVQVLSISKQQIRTTEERKEVPSKYSVNLALTPQEAEKLFFAQESGRIMLTLRNLRDNETVNTQGIIRNDIVPQKDKVPVVED